MKTVSLVGSTGSIGTQAVDVVTAEPDRFSVVALAAQRSVDVLAEQAQRLRPALVAIGDASLAAELAARLPPGTELVTGPAGLVAAAEAAEVVVNGVVGFAGLPVTMAALMAGRRLALANKESLIAGAPVVQQARTTPGAHIVPVDSEHCAIHQCLSALPAEPAATAGDGRRDDLTRHRRRLLITASGRTVPGPQSAEELASVGVEEALAHPTWSMGAKITIDSSTLMNKGLEVIEAHELFEIDYDRIDVVVHPQSVVHSMIELSDGATFAQLSMPDMRLPDRLRHGLAGTASTPPSAPSTGQSPQSLSVRAAGPLGLPLPEPRLRRRAGRRAPCRRGSARANEVAVAAFLAGQLGLGRPSPTSWKPRWRRATESTLVTVWTTCSTPTAGARPWPRHWWKRRLAAV